jgi:hypothetical protein
VPRACATAVAVAEIWTARGRRIDIVKTIMGTGRCRLDGFMADDDDAVGRLFDWMSNADVAWSLPGSQDELRTTQASPTSRGWSTAMWRRTSSADECSL